MSRDSARSMSMRLPGVVNLSGGVPTMQGGVVGITPRASEDYDMEMHGSWRDNVIRVRPSEDFDFSNLHPEAFLQPGQPVTNNGSMRMGNWPLV